MVLLALAFAFTNAGAEQFYAMRAADGTIHIARQALTADYQALFPIETKRVLASSARRAEWRRTLRDAVERTAKQVGLDHALLDAIILVESGYDPDAISSKGAVGLMQLMPEMATELGVTKPHDPYQNLTGGARRFAYLLHKFKDLDLALAAYNAGETAVANANGVPNFPETINYVQTIKALYEKASHP